LPVVPEVQSEAVAERFRRLVNERFALALNEAYATGDHSGAVAPAEKASMHQRKHLKRYNTRSIVNIFNDACLSALHQPELQVENIQASSEDITRLMASRTIRNPHSGRDVHR
jgi:hypothetical protein